jgi:hypothetical protein
MSQPTLDLQQMFEAAYAAGANAVIQEMNAQNQQASAGAPALSETDDEYQHLLRTASPVPAKPAIPVIPMPTTRPNAAAPPGPQFHHYVPPPMPAGTGFYHQHSQGPPFTTEFDAPESESQDSAYMPTFTNPDVAALAELIQLPGNVRNLDMWSECVMPTGVHKGAKYGDLPDRYKKYLLERKAEAFGSAVKDVRAYFIYRDQMARGTGQRPVPPPAARAGRSSSSGGR